MVGRGWGRGWRGILPLRRYSRSRLPNEAIPIKAWDAEVAAQVQEVEGTDVAINGDKIQVLRTRYQNDHPGDIHMGEVEPKIGPAGIERVASVMSGHEVFPSIIPVLHAHSLKGCRVVKPGGGEV